MWWLIFARLANLRRVDGNGNEIISIAVLFSITSSCARDKNMSSAFLHFQKSNRFFRWSKSSITKVKMVV